MKKIKSMVLNYAGRVGNKYPLQIYEDIYQKKKKKTSYFWVKPFKIKIDRLSIEYTFIIYKILYIYFFNLKN